MSIKMNSRIRGFTKKAEGSVKMSNGNHKPYQCPAGKLTVGYGYNLEDNGLPDDIACILLERKLIEAAKLLESNVNCWDSLSDVRQDVLIDMCYNMGWPTLSKFKMMFAALDNSDYNEAAIQMMDSSWFHQVGVRASKLVVSMRRNKWLRYS